MSKTRKPPKCIRCASKIIREVNGDTIGLPGCRYLICASCGHVRRDKRKIA